MNALKYHWYETSLLAISSGFEACGVQIFHLSVQGTSSVSCQESVEKSMVLFKNYGIKSTTVAHTHTCTRTHIHAHTHMHTHTQHTQAHKHCMIHKYIGYKVLIYLANT